MTEFIMTIGLPASGKSTWARSMQKEGYYWLSSDEIRKATNCTNTQIFAAMNETAKRLLLEGTNVIYDATNLWKRYRMHTLNQLKGLVPSVHFHAELFLAPYDTLLIRNSNRLAEARVPYDVMDKFMRVFQLPQSFEGWDEININKDSIGEWFNYDKCVGFNQLNPHHELTLSQHMNKAYDIAKEKNFDAKVKVAAIFHDIGKVLTQTIDKDGVAHYYGHENVGAYLFMLDLIHSGILELDSTYSDYEDIIFLINYHMRPYQWTEKAYEKDLKLFGKHRIKMLKQLHYCDEAAH